MFDSAYPKKIYPNLVNEISLDSLITSISIQFEQISMDSGATGLQFFTTGCYHDFYSNFHSDFMNIVSKDDLNEKITSRLYDEVFLDRALQIPDGYIGLKSQPYNLEFYRLFSLVMNKSLEELILCSAYDMSAYIKDASFVQVMGWPPHEFFSFNNTAQRLLSALTMFGFSEDTTYKILGVIIERNYELFQVK